MASQTQFPFDQPIVWRPSAECVRDIPKTRNAKVMRRVIRAAYLGQPPGDLSVLVNPEAVREIRQAV